VRGVNIFLLINLPYLLPPPRTALPSYRRHRNQHSDAITARIHIINRIVPYICIQVETITTVLVLLRKTGNDRVVEPCAQVVLLRDRVELLARVAEAVRNALCGRYRLAEGIVLIAVQDATETVRDSYDISVLIVQVEVGIPMPIHLRKQFMSTHIGCLDLVLSVQLADQVPAIIHESAWEAIFINPASQSFRVVPMLHV